MPLQNVPWLDDVEFAITDYRCDVEIGFSLLAEGSRIAEFGNLFRRLRQDLDRVTILNLEVNRNRRPYQLMHMEARH